MGSKVSYDLFGTILMLPRAGVVDVSTILNTHTSMLKTDAKWQASSTIIILILHSCILFVIIITLLFAPLVYV